MKGPCYNCTVRHSGCHGKCGAYKEWLLSRPQMPPQDEALKHEIENKINIRRRRR